jgi:phosphoglycolate phosphatase-like HAD superfamily hydrolase
LVTQEEVRRPKPHPEALLRACALCGGDADDPREHSICVGDTRLDIEAGKAAGVRTIGVTYGISTPAEIAAAQPDHVIDAFTRMRAFVIQHQTTRRYVHPSSPDTLAS